jgi:hypothetical protein
MRSRRLYTPVTPRSTSTTRCSTPASRPSTAPRNEPTSRVSVSTLWSRRSISAIWDPDPPLSSIWRACSTDFSMTWCARSRASESKSSTTSSLLFSPPKRGGSGSAGSGSSAGIGAACLTGLFADRARRRRWAGRCAPPNVTSSVPMERRTAFAPPSDGWASRSDTNSSARESSPGTRSSDTGSVPCPAGSYGV